MPVFRKTEMGDWPKKGFWTRRHVVDVGHVGANTLRWHTHVSSRCPSGHLNRAPAVPCSSAFPTKFRANLLRMAGNSHGCTARRETQLRTPVARAHTSCVARKTNRRCTSSVAAHASLWLLVEA